MSAPTRPSVRPLLLITMGDVAGVGPEIIARGWADLNAVCWPVVVGDPSWLRRAADLVGARLRVEPVRQPAEVEPAADLAPCVRATEQDLASVRPGHVSAAAGRAAFDFL